MRVKKYRCDEQLACCLRDPNLSLKKAPRGQGRVLAHASLFSPHEDKLSAEARRKRIRQAIQQSAAQRIWLARQWLPMGSGEAAESRKKPQLLVRPTNTKRPNGCSLHALCPFRIAQHPIPFYFLPLFLEQKSPIALL